MNGRQDSVVATKHLAFFSYNLLINDDLNFACARPFCSKAAAALFADIANHLLPVGISSWYRADVIACNWVGPGDEARF